MATPDVTIIAAFPGILMADNFTSSLKNNKIIVLSYRKVVNK